MTIKAEKLHILLYNQLLQLAKTVPNNYVAIHIGDDQQPVLADTEHPVPAHYVVVKNIKPTILRVCDGIIQAYVEQQNSYHLRDGIPTFNTGE